MRYFKEKENLLKNTEELTKIVQRDFPNDIDEINFFAKELQDISFNVLCIGDFSSGKSTFINNFFLEEKVKLPVRATTTTAKLTIVKYGDTLKISAIMKDKSKVEIHENVEESLREMIAAKGSKIDEVDFVEVEIPSTILKEGVVIVDSPGLNDPETERMGITFDFINQADCVLYFLNATQAWKKSEKEFLEEKILNKNDLDKVFFLLNYWDTIETEDERSEIVEYVNDEIKKSIDIVKEKLNFSNIDTPPLVPISSKTGENFEALKIKLFSYLTTKKAQEILEQKNKKLYEYIDNFLIKIENKEKLIQKNRDTLNKEQAHYKQELAQYESQVIKSKQRVKKAIANSYSVFVDDLRYAYKQICAEFERNFSLQPIKTTEDFKKAYSMAIKKSELKTNDLITTSAQKFKRNIQNIFEQEKSILEIPITTIMDINYLDTQLCSLKQTSFTDSYDNYEKVAGGATILSAISGMGVGIYSLGLPTTTTVAATPGLFSGFWGTIVGTSATTTTVAGASALTVAGLSFGSLALLGGVSYFAIKKLSQQHLQKSLQLAISESVTNLEGVYSAKIISIAHNEDIVSETIADNMSNEFIKTYKNKLSEYDKIKTMQQENKNFHGLKQQLLNLRHTSP